MRIVRSTTAEPVLKVPSGVEGFDDLTRGGLPRGGTTLIVGGPDSGKTVFAMQFLVEGARNCKERGMLVAFEESRKRIGGNFESFGWGRVQFDAEEAELEVRATSLRTELVTKRVEKTLLIRMNNIREKELDPGRLRTGQLRGADATVAGDAL
jgi:KaiC/GvpD/RAD55 family RecA-like ATPase